MPSTPPATSSQGTQRERVRNVKVPAARIVFDADDRARVLELVDRALQTGALTLGPVGAELEAAFAARHQAPHAIAVSSGTSAIEIVVRALPLAGREVIVPANTFFATAAAVLHAGGRVRFADVDPQTLALSVATVEAALTPDTAAVVLVHIGGLITPEVEAIRDLCDGAGVLLVEDAAHAHGSSLDGQSAGTFGVAGTFSFYPTKVITSGEGGMIITDDERAARRGPHLPRPGQGRLPRRRPRPARLRLAHERAARRDRARPARPARRVHRHPPASRPRLRRRLRRAPGLRPLPVPASCSSNYYKYIAVLARTSTAPRSSSGCARSTT